MPSHPPDVSQETLPCCQCGYDLRATPVEGNCPECGKPVKESIERRKGMSLKERVVRAALVTAAICTGGFQMAIFIIYHPTGRMGPYIPHIKYRCYQPGSFNLVVSVLLGCMAWMCYSRLARRDPILWGALIFLLMVLAQETRANTSWWWRFWWYFH